jgi:molybdate transport system regulatory protein
MHTLSAEEAAELLHLKVKRVQILARQGKLPAFRVGRKWLFRGEELEQMMGGPASRAERPLEISARNRLRGTVTRLSFDGLMAEVQLRIGDQDLVALITRASAERLRLAVGGTAFAVIKSTEVMIGSEGDVA